MHRRSDGKVRRDSLSAAFAQPQHAVDERGGLHGAPELLPVAQRSVAGSRKVF